MEKRCAIYARKAVGEEDKLRLVDQAEQCRAYAMEQGFQAESILFYGEVARGEQLSSPTLTQLRQDAHDHKFEILIVTTLDRLCGNEELLTLLLDELKAPGIEIISIDQLAAQTQQVEPPIP